MIVGTLILNPTKQNIISLGKGKFDFILLDFQHSAFTWETADYVIETVYTYTDKKIWIRVANNNFSDINRAYDIGADAVVVPLINTMNDLKILKIRNCRNVWNALNFVIDWNVRQTAPTLKVALEKVFPHQPVSQAWHSREYFQENQSCRPISPKILHD